MVWHGVFFQTSPEWEAPQLQPLPQKPINQRNRHWTLWAAVARKERLTGAVLGAEERIDRSDALRALTLGGAYFSFDEGVRGSLEPGKQADLAVLSDDFLDVEEDRLPELTSVMTMVGGKIVHGSDRF